MFQFDCMYVVTVESPYISPSEVNIERTDTANTQGFHNIAVKLH